MDDMLGRLLDVLRRGNRLAYDICFVVLAILILIAAGYLYLTGLF